MKKIQWMLIGLFLGTQIIPAVSQNAYLSEVEMRDVIDMLEEEKLARDVYLELGNKWDSQVFQNIATAEERHYGYVKQMARDHDLPVPATVQSDEKGKFENQDLQVLYDELIRTGDQSLINALEVGAKIEELDIKDLDLALSNTADGELTELYNRLKRASENHLRAFTQNLERQGVHYQPVILAKEQYDKIIAAANGQGACCSGNQGMSNGKRKKGKNKAKGPGIKKERGKAAADAYNSFCQCDLDYKQAFQERFTLCYQFIII